MGIVIRKLHANDLNKLLALWSKHLFSPGTYEVSLSFTTPDAWAQKDCKRLYIQYMFDKPLSILGLETYVCAVAQADDGEIVGTVIARRKHPLAKTWQLGMVVVHASFRHLGIATHMISSVMSHLRKKKAKEVTLWVERESVPARLYEKMGFEYLGPLFVTFGYIKDLLIETEQCFQRRNAEVHLKKVPARPSVEWFEKIVSVFLSIFFREFPRKETFVVISEGKAVGYVKVDNSKFRSTGIVEEIHLHPEFRRKSFIKVVLKAIFKILRDAGIEKVVFRVAETSIDRSLLRNILLELNLRSARVWYIMSKKP